MELTRQAGQLTLGALFQQRARLQPDAPALSDGTIRLAYGELADRVTRDRTLDDPHHAS